MPWGGSLFLGVWAPHPTTPPVVVKASGVSSGAGWRTFQEEVMAAYVIITKLRTRNPAELELYAKERPNFLRGHSVKFLARFGRCEVVEGAGVEGVAILEFPTFAAAQAWYQSPVYQEASQHRFKGGDYSAVIIEGAAAEATK